MAAVCGGVAFALDLAPAVALAGAGLAALVRVLAGGAPAALTAAVLAPLLAVATLADAGADPGRTALALAAAGWTVAELARLSGEAPTPARYPAAVVAVATAAAAAILDPSFVALVGITGLRLVTARRVRPHGALAVALAGVVAVALAVLAGTVWPALGAWWYGAPADPVAVRALAARTADCLGPITAVAALAGLASLARARYAELAVAAVVASSLAVDLRAGTPGPATIGLAALLSGLAIARLAAMIRVPSAQAIAGAAIGVVLVVPPAWTAVAQRSRVAHTGHASR